MLRGYGVTVLVGDALHLLAIVVALECLLIAAQSLAVRLVGGS